MKKYQLFPVILILLIAGCIPTKRLINDNYFIPPELNVDLKPEYPIAAKKQSYQGNVGLLLLISDSGDVKFVDVERSSGVKILDDAAVDYASKLSFIPANRNGVNCYSKLTWGVKYELTEKIFPQTPEEKFLEPATYINQSRELQNEIVHESKDMSSTLRELLDFNDKFAAEMKYDPSYNHHIRELILPETYTEWSDIWNDYPLRFVIFYDCIERYGETRGALAKTLLKKYAKEDIAYIKRSDKNERKDVVLNTIYTRLNQRFPALNW